MQEQAVEHPKLYLSFVLIGLILGICAFTFAAESQKDFDPENFGLGLDTQPRIARSGDDVFSVTGNERELRELLPQFYRTAEMFTEQGRSIILWLGASQVHSINKKRDGDKLAVEYANVIAVQRGSLDKYFQISSPNANFHDLLGIYAATRQQFKPKWLVVALVYDDLREHPLQKFLLEFIPQILPQDISVAGEPLAEVERERAAFGREAEAKSVVQRNAVHGTPQERLEKRLIEFMPNILPGYEYRDALHAKISSVLSNFMTRAAVELSMVRFGAKLSGAQRYPDIPKYLVDWNFAALRSLVTLARKDGVQVVLYRQPIRPTDEDFYHNRADYDAFYERATKELLQDGVYLLDLENIVPQELWGTTNLGYPDVFHFTSEGHKLLASAIDSFFGKDKTHAL